MPGVETRKGIFKYCPSCGKADIYSVGPKELRCRVCSFTYFHNVAIGVAAVLEFGGKIVLLKRGCQPGKGKLDLPGGFAEPQESAEETLKRELMEELKLEIKAVRYLGSRPNVYKYEGVVYQTCDLFFHSKIDALPTQWDKEEIAGLLVLAPADIPCDQIAFQSTKAFLTQYIATRTGQGTL